MHAFTGSSEQGAGGVRAKSGQAQKSATACPHMVNRDVAHSLRVRDDRVPDGRLRSGVFAAGKKKIYICIQAHQKQLNLFTFLIIIRNNIRKRIRYRKKLHKITERG